MPLKTGVDTWFTRQQNSKYVGHAEVSIEANGPAGFAVTEVTANRSFSLPENPTPTEKQDAYYSLITDMMRDLDQNLQSGIHSHLRKFVITAPIYGATAVPMTIAPMVRDIVSPITTAPVTPTESRASVTIPLSDGDQQ